MMTELERLRLEVARLRFVLIPFKRQWEEVEARGRHRELMSVEPVRVIHLRDAAYVLGDEGGHE